MTEQKSGSQTKIYSRNVGQADARLVVTEEEKRILVDADEDKIEELTEFKEEVRTDGR